MAYSKHGLVGCIRRVELRAVFAASIIKMILLHCRRCKSRKLLPLFTFEKELSQQLLCKYYFYFIDQTKRKRCLLLRCSLLVLFLVADRDIKERRTRMVINGSGLSADTRQQRKKTTKSQTAAGYANDISMKNT